MKLNVQLGYSVILSASLFVILGVAKNLLSPLRINSAKNPLERTRPFAEPALRFFGLRPQDEKRRAQGDTQKVFFRADVLDFVRGSI